MQPKIEAAQVDRLVLKTMATAPQWRGASRFLLRDTQQKSGGIAAFPTR
jgi:hypothetical protein